MLYTSYFQIVVSSYPHRYIHGSQWPNLRESDFDHIGAKSGVGFNCNIPLNKVFDVVDCSDEKKDNIDDYDDDTTLRLE